MNKFSAIAVVLLVVSLFLVTPPKREVENNALLFANPLLLRALSSYAHTFLADKLWLLSSTVAETGKGGSNKVDREEFVIASKAITHLDPYFYEPTLYTTTFLTSIFNDIKSTLEILTIVKQYDAYNFERTFLELILYVTYIKEHIDVAYVRLLIEQLKEYKESEQQFGKFLVSDWLDDFVRYANSEELKKNREIEDLVWLYSRTHDVQKKKKIRDKLALFKINEEELEKLVEKVSKTP